MKRLLLLCVLLAACGSGEGPLRYPVSLPASEGRVAVNLNTLEVRDVVLPLYAELEEIYVEGPDGALRSDSNLLWADEPRRAVTQGLALAIGDVTRARVAAEPWPFDELPDARLEMRFEDVIARSDGTFLLSGQYFLARSDGGRDREGRFRIEEPVLASSLAAVGEAQGRALARLARLIAEEAL